FRRRLRQAADHSTRVKPAETVHYLRSGFAPRDTGTSLLQVCRWRPDQSIVVRSAHVSVAALGPHSPLPQTKQGAAALGADLLIMSSRSGIDFIFESKLWFDRGQIANHHRRRKRAAAPEASRLLRVSTCILVKADPKLRRTLKQVEELSERQPDQRENDG